MDDITTSIILADLYIFIKEDKLDDMKLLLEGNVPFAVIGTVSDDGFVVKDNDEIININVDELVKANTTTIETHMA